MMSEEDEKTIDHLLEDDPNDDDGWYVSLYSCQIGGTAQK